MGGNSTAKSRRREEELIERISSRLRDFAVRSFLMEGFDYAYPNRLPDVHASRFHQDAGGSGQDAREGKEDRLRRRADVRARADRRKGTGEDTSRRRTGL